MSEELAIPQTVWRSEMYMGKTGRFGTFSLLCFLALEGHCLQMLCLPGCGTHENTQNLPHLRAFTASVQELSPQNAYFSWQTKDCQIVPVVPPTSTEMRCRKLVESHAKLCKVMQTR